MGPELKLRLEATVADGNSVVTLTDDDKRGPVLEIGNGVLPRTTHANTCEQSITTTGLLFWIQ